MAATGNYMDGVFRNSTQGVIDNSTATHGKDNANLLNQTQFQKELLELLIQSTTDGHSSLLQKETLQSNAGFSITYTRPDPIGQGAELTEGVTPAGGEWTAGTISGTLRQYGKVMYATDVSGVKLNYNVMDQIKKQLKTSAALTIDSIARKEIHTQAGIVQLPSIFEYPTDGSRMKVKEQATQISEITTEMGFNFWDIYAVYMTMVTNKVANMSQTIKVITGVSGKMSLLQDPWFMNCYYKNGDDKMWNNNGIMSFGPFTFKFIEGVMSYSAGSVVTERTGKVTDNTAKVNLDTAIIMVGNAGVSLDLSSGDAGGAGVRYYENGLISTKEDPLAQRQSTGYKFWYGVLLHTPQRVAIYYFASPTQGQIGTQKVSIGTLTKVDYDIVDANKNSKAADIAAVFQQRVSNQIADEFKILGATDYSFSKVTYDGVEFSDEILASAAEHSALKLELTVKGQNNASNSKITRMMVQIGKK